MSNAERFVVPLEGLTVRDPISMTPLPAKGATVPWNSFWRRRANDGSVVVRKAEVQAPAQPTEIKEPVDEGSYKSKRR